MKILINFFFFYALFSLGTLVFAADCSTIELDKKSGSMSNIPVLEQGQTATCYAHAGSSMLDAHMQSVKGKKDFVSNPFLAALLTNPDIFSGGLSNFSCDAINNLAKFGNCDLVNLKNNLNLSQLLKKVEKFYVLNNNSNSSEFHSVDPKTFSNANALMCLISDAVPEVLSGKNINDFVSILNNKNKVYYIEEVVKLICKNQLTPINNPPRCIGDRRVRHGGESKSNEYKDKINSLLEKENAQPVGIGYCANVLMKGKDYVGFKPGFLGFTSVSDLANCGLHESVVIGRKKVGNKCFFKIRNSWGKYFYSHPDWINQNDGNVWVEEDALTANMGSLSYLE